MINFNLLISQEASFSQKGAFSNTEYPEVTANMAGRSKEKQLAVSSDNSDTESEGVCRHTRTRTGVVALVNYSALAWGINVTESHSAIAESQVSNEIT